MGKIIQSHVFGVMFPFSDDHLSVRAFSNAWLTFTLEMIVLCGIEHYAAQEPAQNGILVLTIAILEWIRGAGGDFLWMMRGWPTADYIPFMIVHLIIAVSGIFY